MDRILPILTDSNLLGGRINKAIPITQSVLSILAHVKLEILKDFHDNCPPNMQGVFANVEVTMTNEGRIFYQMQIHDSRGEWTEYHPLVHVVSFYDYEVEGAD